MKTVYKYPLVIDDYQKVTLPINAKLLCIKKQNEKLCLWVLIDKEETCTEQITIRCAGTGHPIKENVEYIDSIMMMGGSLVFHFFKVIL